MSLCLVGNQSLDQLQAFAEEHFHDIENKNIQKPDFSNEKIYDSENGLGHVIKIVPEKDLKSLSITWPDLPETTSKYKTKPGHYIGHVVGHEGPNSLISTLIKQGLATSLSAGFGDRLN